jgi:two-component system response regulator HydG
MSMTESVQTLEQLMSREPSMFAVFDLIRMAAPAEVNVLILGEHGTGKELVADAVHALSARRDRPFVKINCAAIPAELLESELFGHRRGAFTGAEQDKKGLFELASGGSLLLDEIGDMSPHLQVKLLRALQEREFTPLGGSEPIQADVRLICSTNVDVAQALENGRLRRDLFFRINTITIRVPALRERRRDVRLLAQMFLTRYADRYERPARVFRSRAIAALESYAWPGNVRELEHVLERTVLMTQDEKIDLAALPDFVKHAGRRPRADMQLGGCRLEDVERWAIQQTLDLTGGNKRAAAKLLGIHRPTFYNKLRKYELVDAIRVRTPAAARAPSTSD